MKILMEQNETIEIGILNGEENIIRISYIGNSSYWNEIIVTAELEGNIKGKGIIYHQRDTFDKT